MLAKSIYGNILAHFDTAFDLNTYLAHHVDLRLDDILVELVRRYSVAEHSARFGVLLKHGRFIAHRSQIVCATQTRRTAADDGDLLFPALLDVGADIDLRHKTCLGMQVFLRNEFLHGVDSHGAVDRTARTSVLATAVADTPAHCRERVLAFDQLQCLGVFAFCGFLQITLHGDMCRTSGLTRRRTGLITVDAVLVAVVFRPFLRTPFGSVRQLLFRISLRTMLGAELLTQLHRTCRAVLHAPAAGYAVLRIHFRHVRATRHIRSIKELRGTQRIAYLHVAVADGKDLTLAVYIGHLVYKSVVLGFLENRNRLIISDIVSAACLTQVIRHVAHADTPVAVVVRAAFVQFLAAVTARTDTHAYMSLVFLEPVTDMFDIHTLVLHRDGFLHGDDVHTYSASAHRHHRRDLLQRQECHALEEHRQLRMAVHQVGVHVRVLGAARNEHRHPVNSVLAVEGGAFVRTLTVGVMVAVVVFQHAEIRQLVEQLVETLIVLCVVLLGVHLVQPRVRVMLAYLKEITGQHI